MTYKPKWKPKEPAEGKADANSIYYLVLTMTEAGVEPSDAQIEAMYQCSAERIQHLIGKARRARLAVKGW